MTADELDALLAERAAYYGARAAEYDATIPTDDALRAKLVEDLELADVPVASKMRGGRVSIAPVRRAQSAAHGCKKSRRRKPS